MRRARNGDLLLEFATKAEIAPIKEKITQAIGGSNVRSLNPQKTLELRGLDILTEKADLIADLAAATKVEASQITVRSLREIKRTGTRTGVFVVSSRSTADITEGTRIRMGHVIVPVRIVPETQRCFRCHRFGYVSYDCKMQINGVEICRKCGTNGHVMRDCQAVPRCFLCSENKLLEDRLQHVAASAGCPQYRAEIGRRLVRSTVR